MPNVFVIVLQYNKWDTTLSCLESLMTSDCEGLSIVVVDNASAARDRNGARLFVEQSEFQQQPNAKSPKLHFIQNEHNLGYGGGNNVGIQFALENGANYIFILNNDATVASNTIRELVDALESNPKAGIAQACIVEDNRMAYAGGPVRWLTPFQIHTTERQAGSLHSNQYAIGAGMMVRSNVFQCIGGFREEWFLYYEDADFSFRTREVGYEVIAVPDARVTHNISTSTRDLGAARRLYYEYRNGSAFFARHGSFAIRFLLPFWAFFTILKQLVKLAIRRHPAESRAIISAFVDYYSGTFGPYHT